MQSIELFAGAGGLGLGSMMAGARPQMVVERDRWCCKTLRKNTDGGGLLVAPIEEDIRQIDFSSRKGKIDLVTGGPPCQPFSMGGKHRAHEDQRDMWSEAVRVVRETQPKAFVFENVKGLTRGRFSAYFNYISLQLIYPEITRRESEAWSEHLSRLERHHSSGICTGLQYQLIPPRILNAADFGVPQRRERVFFVGFRNDLHADWGFPSPTHSREALLFDQSERGAYFDLHQLPRAMRKPVGTRRLDDVALKLQPWRTVRDAFRDLPAPTTDGNGKWLNHKLQAGAKAYPGHTGSPLDLPAKALKAGVHGVPGGENMMILDDGGVRYFSVRESARLQTFPDDYAIEGSWSEAMRQLGNAVPVELAKIVVGSVMNHVESLDA